MTTQRSPRPASTQQRKPTLLPQAAQLSQEGYSSRQIADKLGVSKTTIGQWLRQMRAERPPKRPLDRAEVIRQQIALYESIYQEALAGWRRSQEVKQVHLVEDTRPADDSAAAKTKRSIRTETRTGDASCLARAMDAAKIIGELKQELAALGQPDAAGGPVLIADLSDDDLERLTPDDLDDMSDEQLFAIQSRLQAKQGPSGFPMPTNEELHDMSDEQLRALEAQLREEIQ